VAYAEVGFRHILSKRAVTNLDSLKGLKIRVPEIKIWVDFWRRMGANPTPLPFPEVYAALEQKAIDGQENPVATINSAKFYEVQKNLTLTRHQYNPQSIMMSKKFWDGLNASEKKLIEEAVAESIKFQRAQSRGQVASITDNLKKNGMQVTELPAAEMVILRDKMKPVIAKHGEAIAATVADLQAELAKIRK
jgi:TRAP-type C4-dicarboxylate transport system substrate-binding protein